MRKDLYTALYEIIVDDVLDIEQEETQLYLEISDELLLKHSYIPLDVQQNIIHFDVSPTDIYMYGRENKIKDEEDAYCCFDDCYDVDAYEYIESIVKYGCTYQNVFSYYEDAEYFFDKHGEAILGIMDRTIKEKGMPENMSLNKDELSKFAYEHVMLNILKVMDNNHKQ